MSRPSLSRVAVCPATQTIFPPSVMTPGENARDSWNGVFSMYSAAVAAVGSEIAASQSIESMRVILVPRTKMDFDVRPSRTGVAGLGREVNANPNRPRQARPGADGAMQHGPPF